MTGSSFILPPARSGQFRRNRKTSLPTSRPLDAPIWVCRSSRSEEHTSELQSLAYLVCRLLLEKKNCKLLMLICILTKNVITACSVNMMLFLHLEVKLFFLHATAPTEIYTLSLHDALPIWSISAKSQD